MRWLSIKTQLNVVAFSNNFFPLQEMIEIFQGGFDKVRETGAVIVGGQTITDDELKYGLAVTGLGHPDKIVKNSTAKPGDYLVLTKPLGTGIITTALKVAKFWLIKSLWRRLINGRIIPLDNPLSAEFFESFSLFKKRFFLN